MNSGVKTAFLIAAILFVMPSCEKVNNPFDPECPKDVWTPENLAVEQVGDALKVNWDQPIDNISGFKIERKVEGGEWSMQTTLDKAARTWTDNNVMGGQLHTYQIYAYAGDNSSNKVTANYTPLIKATAIARAVTEYGDDWARLEGEVNPNGLETTVSFQYKLTSDNQWDNAKATPETLTGSSAKKVNAEVHDLTPGKEYHFKVIASNDAGTTESDNLIAFSTDQGVLNLSSQNINLDNKAGNIEVTVTTNLENLDITDNVSWLNATINGNTIQINYDANDNVESREATITITAGALSKSITVTQAGTNPSIMVTPNSKSVERAAGNTIFTVTSNVSWSVEDDASWLAAVKTNNTTITVTYSENTSSNSRTANIRVYSSEGPEQTVMLEQKGYDTSGTFTDSRDGIVYNWVKIGNQIWMAEDLKATQYGNGQAISRVESGTEWNNLGIDDRAYCWYDNNTSNRDTYGGLYTWSAAMNGEVSSSGNPSGVQGVCPSGWHLPSDEEWKELERFLGMSVAESNATDWRGANEADKLKEQGTEHWISSNDAVSNSTRFTALPGGFRYDDGRFLDIGVGAVYWTATEANQTDAWYRALSHSKSNVLRISYHKKYGFSIRCVKD